MESIAAKFEAFGWATLVIDGNDMASVADALDQLPLEAGKPSAIIARTVKGKGISAIEGAVSSHYWKPSPAELAVAIEECEVAIQTAQAGLVAS